MTCRTANSVQQHRELITPPWQRKHRNKGTKSNSEAQNIGGRMFSGDSKGGHDGGSLFFRDHDGTTVGQGTLRRITEGRQMLFPHASIQNAYNCAVIAGNYALAEGPGRFL